jgi:hypothetical protein
VPIAAFAASANPHLAGALTDGHVETRWDTGAPQASGQWLRADFEDDVDLTAVTLEIGAALSDFPRQFEVLTSRNGRDWVVAWRGSTSPQALLGALAAPGSVPLHLPFSASGVRSVLLRLTADADDWWSVTEFRAYGRSSASTAGRPPPAAP